MAKGEWEEEEDNDANGVMQLSAPVPDDNGDSMEEKVERILELREIVGELEDEIEECRFYFWTGTSTHYCDQYKLSKRRQLLASSDRQTVKQITRILSRLVVTMQK